MKDKFGEYSLSIGDEVVIISADREHILGNGFYKGKGPSGSPKFDFNSGTIHGYQCWWIPEKQARQIRAKHK